MNIKKEVILLASHKTTGLVILVVGVLFFLRDLGMNYIGNTGGWTILFVLFGAALVAGGGLDTRKPFKK